MKFESLVKLRKVFRSFHPEVTSRFRQKLRDILTEVIAQDPRQGKKLIGDLAGSYSYRLSYQDRIVYSVDWERRIVYLERARTYYGD